LDRRATASQAFPRTTGRLEQRPNQEVSSPDRTTLRPDTRIICVAIASN